MVRRGRCCCGRLPYVFAHVGVLQGFLGYRAAVAAQRLGNVPVLGKMMVSTLHEFNLLQRSALQEHVRRPAGVTQQAATQARASVSPQL